MRRRLEELHERRCFVDGDFAMKNMLVGRDRNWVLDFEVAHYGNPIFDLGFFLSFVVLSAVRWPALLSRTCAASRTDSGLATPRLQVVASRATTTM